MKKLLLAIMALLVLIPAIASAAPGSTLWTARYRGSGTASKDVVDLGVSPDGSIVFVTGGSGDATTLTDYATVAYDAATGTKLWARRYNGPGNSYDLVTDLSVSLVGSAVFLTGSTYDARERSDIATVAYDASTGTRLWVQRYHGNRDDGAAALGVSPDGSQVFVSGYSARLASGLDYLTVAYDAVTGAELWRKRYDRESHDNAEGLGVSPDGSAVFVTGTTMPQGESSYATVAYDAATGAKLWVTRFAHARAMARSIAVSPNGSAVFVTGQAFPGEGRVDYMTVAYDGTDGSQLWATRYANAGYGPNAPDLGVSADGSAVFLSGVDGGSTLTDETDDYATVAYDAATGARLWARQFDGGNGADGAHALGVSPDGSAVFVTGAIEGETNGDYATVAYEAVTGATLWVKRFDGGNGSGSDYARAVGVSPDGSAVFVTGDSSSGPGKVYDFLTVAYSAT